MAEDQPDTADSGTPPEELIEQAKDTFEELDARQNEALREIAEGEDLERYEFVELGSLEMKVRAWLPGNVEDTVLRAQELADREDAEALRESAEVMLSALDDMTVSDDYDMRFWREYHSRYGQEGLVVAVETVLSPAQEHIEDRKEGVDGFRSGGPRSGPHDGVRNDGPDAE